MNKIQFIIKATGLGLLISIFVLESSSKGPLRQELYSIVDSEDIEKVKQLIDDEIKAILNFKYDHRYDGDQHSRQLNLLKRALDVRARLVRQGLIAPELNVTVYYSDTDDCTTSLALLEVLFNHKDTRIHASMLAQMLNNVVKPQYCESKTPEECATILHKKICALKLLLAHGAHANMKDTWSSYACNNHSPLYNALNYSYHDVNLANRKNRHTPSEPIVKILIEAGANVHERTHDGHTLLHAAAQSEEQNAGIIKLLVELGVPVNALAYEKKRNETALHAACRKRRYAAPRALLEVGANASIQDSFERTPLRWVLDNWSSENGYDVAMLLIDHTDLSLKNENGLTAWDDFSGDDKGMVGHELIGKFVARGIDINSRGEHGETALHRAAKNGSYTVVEALLNHGARIDVQDDGGNTPLHRAVYAYQHRRDTYPRIKEVIQLLKNRGAAIDLTSDKGTIAHNALKEMERQDRIQKHYGKSLYTLCKENARLKQAWDETWWNVNVGSMKAWISTPSSEDIARMKVHLEIIRSMSAIISECIQHGKEELSKKGNKTGFLRDSGNIANDIVAAVVLFPFALIGHCVESNRIQALQKSLCVMEEAKKELDSRAHALEKLVASF